MSRYKYVTPHWTDQFERKYDDNNESYVDTSVITELDILNDNETETTLTVFFYDGSGNEYEKIRVNSVMAIKNSYYLRICDLVEKANPNYLNEVNRRTGWLKIISSNKLAVTGKITSYTRKDKTTISEVCWTIPFFETQLEDFRTIKDPVIPTDKEPIIIRPRPPFPK